MLIQINTQFSDMAKLRSNPDGSDGNIIQLVASHDSMFSQRAEVSAGLFENSIKSKCA